MDGNGCSNTDSTLIQVDSIPGAGITPAGPFCRNSGIKTLLPSINSGGRFTPTSYLDTLGRFDPFAASSGSYTVYYTFVDSRGCSNIDSTVIQVDSIPDASIVDPGRICLNAGVLRVVPTKTGGTFSGGTFIDSVGDFDPTISGVGSFMVYYTMNDGAGCFSTDSLTIRVDSVPGARIVSAGPFCENAGLQTLNAQTNTSGNFTVTSYLKSNGEFNPNLAQTGLHKVYYTFVDGNGCSNTDSTVVRVDSLPDASILAAGPFCENEGIQVVTPNNGLPGTFTGLGINAGGDFDPSLANPGLHKIFFSLTDGNGCSQTDSINIRVHALPDAGLPQLGPYCRNDGLIRINPYTLGGTFSGGVYIIASGRFTPSLANIGFNKVVYTVTNTNNCTSIDSIMIEIRGVPSNGLTITPHEGCEPLTVLLETVQTGDEDSVHWNVNNQEFINQFQVSLTLQAGIYPVKLQVFSADGCRTTIDTSFEAFPKPVADFDYTPKDIYISNPQVFFTDLSINNVVGWNWVFGDASTSSDQHPNHTYPGSGEYMVQLFIENSDGCLDTTEQAVWVLDELLVFIPNAISPNNDGLNDVFRVTGIGHTNIAIEIFNRWGERVYESDDFKEWDAMYQGNKVPLGSYIYIMTITDNRSKKYYRNGEVTVVR